MWSITYGEDSQLQEEAKGDNSAKVLLLVIFLFLFCNVTSLVVNIFEMFKV